MEKPSVYEQFLATPQYKVAEIIQGALVTHPRPGSIHAVAASTLSAELIGPFWRGRGGPGGWVVLAEPELRLTDDILVPDLAAWRRERMPEIPSVAAFTLAPDWICEVLSPSTEAVDRADKLPIYAAHSVRHAWLVDPQMRTLEVLRLESAHWVLISTYRDEAIVRAEPFDAISLELSGLWSR